MEVLFELEIYRIVVLENGTQADVLLDSLTVCIFIDDC